MKQLLALIFVVWFGPAMGQQCRFATNTFIDIKSDGTWSWHHTPSSIILDYGFDHVKIAGKNEILHLDAFVEIIDEFPVQKFVYPGWVVMFSNTNLCDWIGVAGEGKIIIFVNNQLIDYEEVVKLF